MIRSPHLAMEEDLELPPRCQLWRYDSLKFNTQLATILK